MVKKILYMGSFGFSFAQSGGYTQVANSFKRLLEDVEKENKYKYKIDFINIDTYVSDNYFINESYDYCIILTHPLSFNNSSFNSKMQELFKKCNKKYIHIFWETTPLPKTFNWLWDTNIFDGFIASSKYNYDLVQDKIKNKNKKVYLIYPPIYKDEFNERLDIEYKIKNENKFTVLYIGQYTKRKGLEDAVICFTHALSEKEDCQLHLKYHPLSQNEFNSEELIKRNVMMNTTNMKAQIYAFTDNLDRNGIYEVYKQSSLVLICSRGEGFGFASIEAGTIGLPIIWADNSSIGEVSDFKNNYKVNCYYDTAYSMSHYGYETDSQYGIPYKKEIINGLKYYYDLWKKDKSNYYSLCKNNYIDIFNKYNETVSKNQLENLLNE